MKKIFKVIFNALIIFALLDISISSAEINNPACVLMKFTDDTRYDRIQTAEELSARLSIEIVKNSKLRLIETDYIDENMEKMLYDEKIREYTVLDRVMKNNNFNELFESESFNENKAQSIATAQIEQFISPEITSEIGKEHNAEYLIQGTIINLGVGNWWDNDYSEMSNAINMSSSFMGASSASDFSGISSPLGFGGMDVKKNGIGIQCDIRIIKAATGEVIWNKRVTGIASQKQFDTGLFKIGKGKLNSTLYTKAMDKTAQKIVELLNADLESKSLFIK